VNDTVPCEASVVDDDVELAIAKLSGLLHELRNMRIVEQVTGDGKSLAARLVDRVGDIRCLSYSRMLARTN
jgi:hypothetical protein